MNRRERYREDPLPDDLHDCAIAYAQIQTQSACNARCTFCPYQTGAHRSLSQGRMSWDVFEKVVDELATLPMLSEVAPVLQNEPLIDRRLPEMIRHIKRVLPHVRTTLNTNGSMLTPSVVAGLAGAGLDHLTFSINALTKETFDRVHKYIEFETVMANLLYLIDNKPRDLDVTVKSMVVRESAMEFALPKEFSDLLDRVERAGAEFRASAICNRAGAVEDYEDQVVFKSIAHTARRLYCHDLFENINVLYNGDVIACCSDWTRATRMGNLADQSIREVWDGEVARLRREKAAEGRYQDMPGCRDCSIAWTCEQNLGLRSGDGMSEASSRALPQ